MRVVVLLILLMAVRSVDYCQSLADSVNFYVTPQETRVFKLDSYIKGYDLDFDIDDSTNAKLYNSVSLVEMQELTLDDYKAFKSVDVRKSPKANGMGYAALLAQKEDEKSIAFWIGKFDGQNKLPNLAKWKFFTLPQGLTANCFDLRVIDDDGKWGALNCQTVPQNDNEIPQDLLCAINQADSQLSLDKNCQLFPTPFSTRARKSSILQVQSKTFLLSSNKDLNSQKVSVNYIAIYYLNSNNQWTFANIIDGSYLQNPDIQISDFVIGGDNSIVVADSLSSRLIFFNFDLPNDISVSKVVNYQGRPLALAYDSHSDTLLVGTKEVINEHSYKSLETIVGKYEVDTADSLMLTLSATKTLVSYTTQNSNLYIYDRKDHKINYLLAKSQFFSGTQFVLSTENSYMFSFNQLFAQSVYIAQPYLEISKLNEDKVVKVTAKSESETCALQINLKSVEDSSNIVNKMPFEKQVFKVDPVAGLKIKLDDYFGGADLEYTLPEQKNGDFNFEIKHLNQYTFTPSFPKAEATSILQLTSTSFYYIGVNTIQESFIYVDLCTLDGGEITCQSFRKAKISMTKMTIESIVSYRRSSGQSIVLWSYKYSGKAEWFRIESKGAGYTEHGYPLSYSSLHITDSYFLFVSKTGRYISIFFEDAPYNSGISDGDFNPEQLAQVEYFYPREVYIDPSNSNILFVKLPTKIAKFRILDNRAIEYLGIVKSYGAFKLDSEWSVSVDSRGIITNRDNTITEESFNYVDLKYTKSNQILFTTYSDPIQYDSKTQNSYLVSASNPEGERLVKIMKPFNGVVDLEYADLIVHGDVAISENWLLVESDPPLAYFIDSHPTLTATSHLPEEIFKEDVNLTIEVKSKTQTEKSVTEIQGVNYPVSIKNFPNSTIVTLPSSAKSIEIKLAVQKYFSGPISYYSLSCPMCGGSRIHLYGPLVANKTIDTVPAVVDFVKVGDDKVVALSFNTLSLLNSRQEIIKTVTIPKVTCTNLQYNQNINIGLLVFCYSQTGEQILKYSILNNDFIFVTQYVFHAENKISNFDEMFAVNKGTKNYLFILDNDETVDSNRKHSTIKMFDFTDQFTYLGEWSSKSFGMNQIYPINDLQIINSAVFVTIGNYGIGYGSLDDNGNLIDAGTINLSAIPDIQATLLEDSFFKQIELLSSADASGEAKIFLTTTNSLSMVLSLSLKDKVYTYKALKESYYRYGNERLLNWHAITKDAIYLSYYNQQFELVNLVYYKRAESVRTHFSDGVLIRVSKNQLKYHEAILLNSKLITSHISDVASEGQLSVYDTYNDFVLWIDYEEGGKFDAIEIQAFNDYKQASHMQPVKFDLPPVPPNPDSDGLKWYIILIVALAVLIAVGVAYGLFVYMKKKRAEKNVSLLTEKQEDDVDEDDKKESFDDTITKDANRTSINAD